jgi:hypothetical protein
MTYILNAKHVENVLKLQAPGRYDYFIKRIADWGEIWALRTDDGWTIARDDEEREIFPVWPHRLFAELCAHGEWSDSTPTRISLSEWLESWIPELIANKRLVGVFPLPEGVGIPVDPEQIGGDLREELSRIED